MLASRSRLSRGALVLSSLPNALPHSRLGLMIGARVGGAVVRNRLKRVVREAFRLEQHHLPGPPGSPTCYDYVIGVRPLPTAPRLSLPLARQLVRELARDADAAWRKRRSLAGPPDPSPPAPASREGSG